MFRQNIMKTPQIFIKNEQRETRVIGRAYFAVQKQNLQAQKESMHNGDEMGETPCHVTP